MYMPCVLSHLVFLVHTVHCVSPATYISFILYLDLVRIFNLILYFGQHKIYSQTVDFLDICPSNTCRHTIFIPCQFLVKTHSDFLIASILFNYALCFIPKNSGCILVYLNSLFTLYCCTYIQVLSKLLEYSCTFPFQNFYLHPGFSQNRIFSQIS